MRRALALLTGTLILASIVACRPEPTPLEGELMGAITEAGSTTVQPLAEKLAEAFMAKHPGVRITIQGGGSSVGVKSVGEGVVDVGAASRELKPSERDEYPDIVVHTIAFDGIAIIVHPQVPVAGLTREQVRDIFAGRIVNWKEVGGPDGFITVVSREEGSGTRAAFEEMVMGEALITEKAILLPFNGAVRTAVALVPHSIGYISFGYLDPSVKALAIDGVEPVVEKASSGEYPVVRPLNLLTRGEPQGLVRAWLDFIFGPEGQRIVAEEGYIPVRAHFAGPLKAPTQRE